MTTIQGIISTCVENANVQSEALGNLSTNIANTNTTGYKSVRFEDYLTPDGGVSGVKRYNYDQGSLMITQKPLDIAIEGSGFIQVTRKDGLNAYTRDGSFGVNSQGFLVTSDGFLVGSGIKIPANYEKVKIEPNGIVKVILERNEEPQILGQIPVAIFKNPEGLKSIEGNKLISTSDSGEPTLQKDHKSIKQGFLEKSNTDVFSTVSNVLRLNACTISSIRLIKVADEIYRQSINLRQ